MDKLITHEGQMPVWLDDFEYMQQCVSDALTLLIRSFYDGETKFVLTLLDPGISYNSTTKAFEWGAGAVALAGEILKVDAGSLASDDSTVQLYYHIESTYDSDGSRTMKDGSEVDCYQIRKATISTSPSFFVIGSALSTTYDDFVKKHLQTTSYEFETTQGGKLIITKSVDGVYMLKYDLDYTASSVESSQLYDIATLTGLSDDDLADLLAIASSYGIVGYIPSSGSGGSGNAQPVKIEIAETQQGSTCVLGITSSVFSFGSGHFNIYTRL